jgi:SAM-dependent methyltransferase
MLRAANESRTDSRLNVGNSSLEVNPSVKERARNWFRSLLYPGLDLHTRSRAALCVFWKTGARDVLDAGSGNCYFSWLAYKSGARVLALNIAAGQVKSAEKFLFDYKGVSRQKLTIKPMNLYDLPTVGKTFDEIICYEVLEHLVRDQEVVSQFYALLNPGGVLHLCSPFRLHPHHRVSDIELEENGGHVRTGYTEVEYRGLLEPLGFKIDKIVGLGSSGLYYADRVLRLIRNRFGDVFALPLFPFTLPFVYMNNLDPRMPFSLYVRAIKPPLTKD